MLKRARSAAEGLLARLPLRRKRKADPPAGAQLLEVERAALEPAWAPFFEALAADLAVPGATTRDGALFDPALAERLTADLSPTASPVARARALETLSEDPEVLSAFREACEGLIEEELATRGGEWFFQLAVDAVHLLPAVAAGVVIVKTGGLGADVAVGSAGALSTLLAERLSRLLGTRVAWRARERWTELRGVRVSDAVLSSVLAGSRALLEGRADDQGRLADELRAAIEEVSWSRPVAVRA